MKSKSIANESDTKNASELMAAFTAVVKQAQRFFQQSAECTDSSNLRRQFSTLAQLHQQVLFLLPHDQHSNAAAVAADFNDLYLWYHSAIHDTSQRPYLQRIRMQLDKQLQLQKSMIRANVLSQYKMNLLHFTASLQIAADQLAETTTPL